MQKMKRGSAAGNYKSPEFFATINAFATANCTQAIPLGLKCCPSVREELGVEGQQRVLAAIAEHRQWEQQHQQQREQVTQSEQALLQIQQQAQQLAQDQAQQLQKAQQQPEQQR